jgi:hypothetical protein
VDDLVRSGGTLIECQKVCEILWAEICIGFGSGLAFGFGFGFDFGFGFVFGFRFVFGFSGFGFDFGLGSFAVLVMFRVIRLVFSLLRRCWMPVPAW